MIKINTINSDKTIEFAAEELKKYIEMIDNSETITHLNGDILKENLLNIGICEEYNKFLPDVPNQELDDAIYIDVKNCKGIITGTNPRSVLIAVYRFLKEIGCKFIRPGKDNEIIPECKISEKCVKVCEKASYRHREVCIEGSCSYEHVSDLIDWLPKIAMNGYFLQFMKPYGFFNLWYEHTDNPYRTPEPKTENELAEIHKKIVDEIVLRGLFHFAVGHTWTSEPLGIKTTYWDVAPEPPSPEIRNFLAEFNGKRDWYQGIPLNTNLCYSNPEVRKIIVNAVVEYVRSHPAVDYVDVTLADSDYECECELCRTKTLSDWYVILLNEVDEALTQNGLDCKVACNDYNLTFWPPMEEKIENQDRFVLLHSPIFRDFSATFPLEIGNDYDISLPPIDKCRNKLPKVFKSIEKNVAFIKSWQKIYNGDSLMFDYQLMWFHHNDPGYMMVSENLCTDMKALETLGINGMHSCQCQRVFFPTALPMISMAETLWNNKVEFEDIKNEYMTAAFGKDGVKLAELLNIISQRDFIKMSSGSDASNWAKFAGEETKKLLIPVYEAIEKLQDLINKNANDKTHPEAVKRSWYYLTFYPVYATYWADLWKASYCENDREKAFDITWEYIDYLNKIDCHIDPVADGYRMPRIARVLFEKKK